MLHFFQRLAVAVQTRTAGGLRREEGQTLVEYALIIALVSVALVASLQALRSGIAGVFTKIVNALNNST
jgi:pilus assembly protein Flp/PilA